MHLPYMLLYSFREDKELNNLRYAAWKYAKCKHHIYTVKHNYHKHQIVFKLEKNSQKPTIIEICLCGKENIQINLISFYNTENLWRLVLSNCFIQVNHMAKGRECIPSRARRMSQRYFSRQKFNSPTLF